MRRWIKWIIIIIIILLIFPGILPAIDRFAHNIGLNMPSLTETFNHWKGKTEQTIDKGKEIVEDGIDKGKEAIDNVKDGINDVKDKVNDIPNQLNKDSKPSGTEDIDNLIARIEVEDAQSSYKYNRDEFEKPKKTFNGMSIRNYGILLSKWTIDGSDSNFQYKDPYTNKIETNRQKLDWDHIIPLSYVFQHNGDSWSNDKKRTYAFDTHVGVATHQTENRKKGDSGPSKYMPPANQSAYCYTWFSLADEWDISMTQKDIDVCRQAIYNDLSGAYLLID